MATISCSSTSSLFFNPIRSSTRATSPPTSLWFPSFQFARSVSLSLRYSSKHVEASRLVVKAVAEEEAGLVSEGGEEVANAPSEDTVSVPVSPSDMLIMYFKAEGTMDDTAIPGVTGVLEAQDGIYDLEVTNSEGVATVVLTKETTVQATGVASKLVELIQSSGFKLHTLSLSFEDEEDEMYKKSMINVTEVEEE
ncbi:hypothetical protein LUZ63_009049 [Rhynchospora breviuscula]|uniref:Uncharacterized protein n=1 Tax=Rhynchospora breviuscula TaxID=2022672 RepID=A0A9Q0HN48_9POAL|nr:hypothetical protein LUZ63_009049 [Rhynchospora breviuscula]